MSTSPAVEDTNNRTGQRTLIAYCLERGTLLFSIKMALIVGTILALINHGQAMFTGHFTYDQLVPLLLTYCVPFTVSMYSQVQGKRERDRLYAETVDAAKQSEIEAKFSE
jgi:hypothetical protein